MITFMQPSYNPTNYSPGLPTPNLSEVGVFRKEAVGALEILEKVVTQLSERLTPILKPENSVCPQNSAVPIPADSSLCDIAGDFRTISRTVEAISNRISGHLSRLGI